MMVWTKIYFFRITRNRHGAGLLGREQMDNEQHPTRKEMLSKPGFCFTVVALQQSGLPHLDPWYFHPYPSLEPYLLVSFKPSHLLPTRLPSPKPCLEEQQEGLCELLLCHRHFRPSLLGARAAILRHLQSRLRNPGAMRHRQLKSLPRMIAVVKCPKIPPL